MLATLLRTKFTANGSIAYYRYVGNSISVMELLLVALRGWSDVITNCRKLQISVKSTIFLYVMQCIPGEVDRGFG
jgi:hypothetical protein